MIIKQAIGINSEGLVINSFSKDSNLDEYLVIDLICLKDILKNILSVKNNSLVFCFRIIFKSIFNGSIFRIYDLKISNC